MSPFCLNSQKDCSAHWICRLRGDGAVKEGQAKQVKRSQRGLWWRNKQQGCFIETFIFVPKICQTRKFSNTTKICQTLKICEALKICEPLKNCDRGGGIRYNRPNFDSEK